MLRLCSLLALAALVLLTGAPASAGQSADSLVIRDVWIREAPSPQSATAAYLVIENDSDTATSLVAVEGQVADSLELHTMQMRSREGLEARGTAAGGGEMMSMVKVSEVPVPAKGRAELKPGSFHIMLFKLKQPLVAGGTVPLTLRFSNGLARAVVAKVLPRAATSYAGGGK